VGLVGDVATFYILLVAVLFSIFLAVKLLFEIVERIGERCDKDFTSPVDACALNTYGVRHHCIYRKGHAGVCKCKCGVMWEDAYLQ